MHRPEIHQVLATLGYGDAIGHEALGIRKALRRAGFQSEIFVETADPRLEHLTLDYRDLLETSDPGNILIHHFSIGSKASRIAFALPDRMVLVYHNITPPHYFAGIHKELAKLCYRGRRELRAYVQRCDLALGDSEFNRQELEALGFPETAVLPVVPGFDHLEVMPNPFVARDFDDDRTNVLFVGRVIPSKKIEDLIRFFHAYQSAFNPRARLVIVGAHSGFERYLAMLHHLRAELGASDAHLVGQVSDEELTAYYDVADLFLCASEHEGFCVPLVEAFYKHVPVLAYAATAVPSTMDGAGVLYQSKQPEDVAILMDAILSDEQLQDAIIEAQDRAVDRLLSKDFESILISCIERVLAKPSRPHPEVAWDFWKQFEMGEQLEELRMYRPGIYKALPAEPKAQLADFGSRARRVVG
jgi:glycosyltransferase involved in cell wall biosynthesis